MRRAAKKRKIQSLRRRYVVHLLCLPGAEVDSRVYIARIRPWTARPDLTGDTAERVFEDECELIEVINPVLPRGSDVRDVFEHIESPNGFFYLLRLTGNQAAELGWRPESTTGSIP